MVSDGQSEQIGIRDLLVATDHRRPEQRLVRDRHGISPEMVIGLAKKAQAVNQFAGRRARGWVCRIAQHPDTAVKRYGARCPPVSSIPSEPAVRLFVVLMPGVEERHEDVHIQERDAQDASRNSLTSRKLALRA